MDLTITRITPSNLSLLDQVDDTVFDHEIDAGHLEDYANDDSAIMFVAISENRVVGQIRAIILRHPDTAPELYIDRLGVASSARRQGIATQLFKKILNQGNGFGCKEVWLATEPANEPAKAFYRSLGLNAEEMVMFYADM